MRPLGIPVLEDKIVQQAVRMILEPIWENDFADESIGYRPGRSPRKATQELSSALHDGKHRWVVEADTFKRKLQGHWNYFGVIGNSEQTWNFAWFARKLVYKWLNRRSQRKSFTVASFVAAWERWRMPDPQVIEVPLPRTR